MTKKKASIEDKYPEIEPSLKGLEEAYSICLPNLTLPNDAYDKIWHSFQYLNNERSDFFIPLFDTDPEGDKTKFSNRGFYKKNRNEIPCLDFDEYLYLIIEVLIFSQNYDSSLRKQVERYYEKKKKKIFKIQEHRLSKIAELAKYIIYSNQSIKGSDGTHFEDYARISIRHGFEVLKAVFDEVLGVRLDAFKRLENFEDTLRKHLNYFPPNCSPFHHFDVTKDMDSGFTHLERVPQQLSQKPT